MMRIIRFLGMEGIEQICRQSLSIEMPRYNRFPVETG
jgi:hypothetical protein